MKKISLIIVFLLLRNLNVCAQLKQDKSKDHSTSANSAKPQNLTYSVHKVKGDSLYTIKVINQSGDLVTNGKSRDKEAKILQGEFTYYQYVEQFNKENRTNFPGSKKLMFIAKQGSFNNGLPEGRWTTYYPNTTIKTIGFYVTGMKNGIFTNFDKYGNIENKVGFKNDVRDTALITDKISPVYFSGDKAVKEKQYADNYAITGKLNGKNIWMFKRFDLDDNLTETGSYKDPLLTIPEGKFTFYGSIEIFNYKNNAFFPVINNGFFKSQEANFVNGKEDGKTVNFYPNGVLASVQVYKEGKKDGEFKQFDRKGNIEVAGTFVNDKQEGKWLINGKTKYYRNGVLIRKPIEGKVEN